MNTQLHRLLKEIEILENIKTLRVILNWVVKWVQYTDGLKLNVVKWIVVKFEYRANPQIRILHSTRLSWVIPNSRPDLSLFQSQHSSIQQQAPHSILSKHLHHIVEVIWSWITNNLQTQFRAVIWKSRIIWINSLCKSSKFLCRLLQHVVWYYSTMQRCCQRIESQESYDQYRRLLVIRCHVCCWGKTVVPWGAPSKAQTAWKCVRKWPTTSDHCTVRSEARRLLTISLTTFMFVISSQII